MKTPQPIPYQGSKRALASVILSFFPADTEGLIEPFAGSAAISVAASLQKKARRFLINDINRPLIELLSQIVNTPESIADAYAIIWHNQLGKEGNYYAEIRDLFNRTHRPDYFLYILARCVKGAVRYNQNGEFNQSPDKRRLGKRPEGMAKEIATVSKLLKNRASFSCKDYATILSEATNADLIYMDPPYQGTSGERDKRYFSGLSTKTFVGDLEKLNARNIRYMISYDGQTGDKIYGDDLPSFLNLKKVTIDAGRSAQSTLLGNEEITYESLYLSPDLVQQLPFEIPAVIHLKAEQLSLV